MNKIFFKINNNNFLLNLVFFLPLISFFYGFSTDENAAGGGGYNGDSSWIRINIEIFINNNFFDSINHPDFFGNRPPSAMLLHKYLNPFFSDFEKYRATVFFLSLIGPIFFYIYLKLKFKRLDKRILFFLASLLYLSPYYRTSAFWGLDENYSIITFILSFIFIEKIKKCQESTISFYCNFFLIILFSSISVYFDQKFLFVPLICFLLIFFSLEKKFNKLILLLTYLLLSIPYIYLIIIWKGIVPVATQLANPKTITHIENVNKLYFVHIGYAATMMAFYIFPFIFFLKNNIFKIIKKTLKQKNFYFFFLITLLYIFYLYFFFNFKNFTYDEYWVGLGVVHKLSLKITDSFLIREIFTYLSFLISFLLIYFVFYNNKLDFLYLIYFFFISLFLWPLLQEYFDPIITLVTLIIFKLVKKVNFSNVLLLLFYHALFLIIAINYYS